MILGLIILVLLVFFAGVVFVGAPYVPTHKLAVQMALDMLPLKKGDVVVDLGSGDGVFLLAAAKSGYRAVGYEINPILCAVSWLRCLRFRKLVKIKLANFWNKKLPKETAAVFIFGAGPYMKHIARKLEQEAAKKPLYVLSYGFDLPGHKVVKEQPGLYLYKIGPAKR